MEEMDAFINETIERGLRNKITDLQNQITDLDNYIKQLSPGINNKLSLKEKVRALMISAKYDYPRVISLEETIQTAHLQLDKIILNKNDKLYKFSENLNDRLDMLLEDIKEENE